MTHHAAVRVGSQSRSAMKTVGEFTFPVDADSHGIRIDSFLLRQLRNHTRFRLQRLIAAGVVIVNAVPAELPHRVKRGERVTVRILEPPDKLFDAEPLPLDLLHEDEHLVAVNKPAGQIAHPVGKRQTGTLCNALQWHFDRQSPLRGLLRPGIVHRLDRMTSGVMVIAKSFRAHKRLSIQFQRQQVRKEYVAIVEGQLTDETGSIDLPIGQLPGGESILMTTAGNARNPRPAVTEYEVIERRRSDTLVCVRPQTGRIHQIRVHLAAIGHPVAGDEFYGPFGEIRAGRFANSSPTEEEERHLLHASMLTFEHPVTGETIHVAAPMPQEFASRA